MVQYHGTGMVYGMYGTIQNTCMVAKPVMPFSHGADLTPRPQYCLQSLDTIPVCSSPCTTLVHYHTTHTVLLITVNEM